MSTPKKKSNQKFSKFLKRIIDITFSCVGLITTVPLFIILPIIIKLQSEGPAIYKRRVVGKNGLSFFAYKFRTMVKNADKILENDRGLNECFLECFKLKKDPRITRIGYFLRKYSLDEIPQLVNVLLGQMSLVGPRMMTVIELQHYGEHKDMILSVKPGLTGLWQVSGRQNVNFQRRIELDVDYVSNWSLFKDITLIFKTFRVVFSCEGAY